MTKTNTAQVRTLNYRGSDASMVGGTEPLIPDADTQSQWTELQRMNVMSTSFNWYNNTQDAKQATEFLAQWLESSPKRRQLGQLVRKYGSPTTTFGWLARCSSLGLRLKSRELRQIQQYLSWLVASHTERL